MRRVVRDQDDFVFLVYNFGFRVLEIEASGEFLARLIECVVHFLFVHFGDDVERRHFRQGLVSVIRMLPFSARIFTRTSPPLPIVMSMLLFASGRRFSFSRKSLAIFPRGASA